MELHWSISKNGMKEMGIKSAIAWIYEEGRATPIAFIKKPKHVSKDKFDLFLDSLVLKKDFHLK